MPKSFGGWASSRVAESNVVRERIRLCVSVDESQGKETALLFRIRRRLSATGSKKSRRTYRGRPTVRTSQSSHSLSIWLVNKAKVQPKTVQGMLRHAKIQTTLDLYAQDDGDETRAAQGAYLTALGVCRQML